MRAESIGFPIGVTDPQRADVQHALGVSGVRFFGRAAVTAEITRIYELNRDFIRDASDVRFATGLQYAW